MSADLDHLLSESLRVRADAGSPIDPQPLLLAAVAGGRRRRTRRRVVAGLAAAVAVAGLTAATAVLPGHDPAPPVGPSPAPSLRRLSDLDLARMPPAAGRPGAASRPDLVGTDPAVLHFSVDALASASSSVRYSSGPGVESATVTRSAGMVLIVLGRTREAVTAKSAGGLIEAKWSDPISARVQGRPATMRISGSWRTNGRKMHVYSFVWQPVDGLWARYEADGSGPAEGALRPLELIRFDQTRRCALPMRPAGLTVTACTVGLSGDRPDRLAGGSLTVSDGKRRMLLDLSSLHIEPDIHQPLQRSGPYRIETAPFGGSMFVRPGGGLMVQTGEIGRDRFNPAEITGILNGLWFAASLDDPATW